MLFTRLGITLHSLEAPELSLFNPLSVALVLPPSRIYTTMLRASIHELTQVEPSPACIFEILREQPSDGTDEMIRGRDSWPSAGIRTRSSVVEPSSVESYRSTSENLMDMQLLFADRSPPIQHTRSNSAYYEIGVILPECTRVDLYRYYSPILLRFIWKELTGPALK